MHRSDQGFSPSAMECKECINLSTPSNLQTAEPGSQSSPKKPHSVPDPSIHKAAFLLQSVCRQLRTPFFIGAIRKVKYPTWLRGILGTGEVGLCPWKPGREVPARGAGVPSSGDTRGRGGSVLTDRHRPL